MYSDSGVFGMSPLCTCRSTNPGRTYMEVASISFVAGCGLPLGRMSPAVAPTAITEVMRLRSTTMSTGPRGGAPVPSMRVAFRMTSRSKGPSPSARGGAGRGSVLGSCARAAAIGPAAARATSVIRKGSPGRPAFISSVSVVVGFRAAYYRCPSGQGFIARGPWPSLLRTSSAPDRCA